MYHGGRVWGNYIGQSCDYLSLKVSGLDWNLRGNVFFCHLEGSEGSQALKNARFFGRLRLPQHDILKKGKEMAGTSGCHARPAGLSTGCVGEEEGRGGEFKTRPCTPGSPNRLRCRVLPDVHHGNGPLLPGAFGAEAAQHLFAHGGVASARDVAQIPGWGEGLPADLAFGGFHVV